jgi:carbon storage regulator
MLVLSRKIGESVVIDGRIVVTLVRVDGDAVRLGIQAPHDVPVHRQEVYEEIRRNNCEALTQQRPKLPKLARRNPRLEEEARPQAAPA